MPRRFDIVPTWFRNLSLRPIWSHLEPCRCRHSLQKQIFNDFKIHWSYLGSCWVHFAPLCGHLGPSWGLVGSTRCLLCRHTDWQTLFLHADRALVLFAKSRPLSSTTGARCGDTWAAPEGNMDRPTHRRKTGQRLQSCCRFWLSACCHASVLALRRSGFTPIIGVPQN